MNSNQPIPLSVRTPEKPSDFKGALKDFEQGKLCFVVARRYEGKGSIKLILHQAEVVDSSGAIGYGRGEHWVVSPGTLMGSAISTRKSLASRINGHKGGRKPKATIASQQAGPPPIFKPSGRLQ